MPFSSKWEAAALPHRASPPPLDGLGASSAVCQQNELFAVLKNMRLHSQGHSESGMSLI